MIEQGNIEQMELLQLAQKYAELSSLVIDMGTTIQTLKKTVQEQEATIKEKDLLLREKEIDIQYFKFQWEQLKRVVYGSKSERFISNQQYPIPSLFADLESAPGATPEPQTEPEKQIVQYERTKPSVKPAKKGRGALPTHLKRVDTIIEPENLPESARKIGEEITETLEYQEARLYVNRTIRLKYAIVVPEVDPEDVCVPEDAPVSLGDASIAHTSDGSLTQSMSTETTSEDQAEEMGSSDIPAMNHNGERTTTSPDHRPATKTTTRIIIAPMPPTPIPKCMAGTGLLAYICVSKFVDHLPFYRQLAMFKREKVFLQESTLRGWYAAVCRLLEPLYENLHNQILQSTYIQADESPMPVQDSDKPGATHKGYQWVYHAPLEGMVYFMYDKSRSGTVCWDTLTGWTGTLQTDGYSGYKQFGATKEVCLIHCMAHARRKFEKALNESPAKAKQMMGYIQQLYAIERQARDKEMSHQERYELRQQKSLPILTLMKAWLDKTAAEVLPKQQIGQAIQYMLNLWDGLIGYTTDGRYEIDNNPIENKIRPATLGRKNYLFAGSHDAAQRNAMMYSFFGCCKINDVNPLEWLKDVIERMPDCKPSRYAELLPHNWIKENQQEKITEEEKGV